MKNTKTSIKPKTFQINLKNLPPLDPSIVSPLYQDKYENPSPRNQPIVANPSSEFHRKTDSADGNSRPGLKVEDCFCLASTNLKHPNNTFNKEIQIRDRHANLVVPDGPKKASAKSKLHDLCAANNWKHPLYECCKEEGASHMKLFTFKVVVEMREETSTTILECFSEPRPKKKMAADHAAEGALWYLRHIGYLLSKPS
ncbi:hypothetical protein Goari_025607 [Gossypium aridum]|uniref:DRBM domain-containing protein n=1 Tax=Gossypium aridum TaxID=34290 RepID=A0A7J8XB32_GOSAI|nr:hypothetical protein [Gossypium aridum]